MRKMVSKIVDWAIMSACLAVVLVFSFMAAGASASRLAIGEQEVKK
jgi:hypothetical protein